MEINTQDQLNTWEQFKQMGEKTHGQTITCILESIPRDLHCYIEPGYPKTQTKNHGDFQITELYLTFPDNSVVYGYMFSNYKTVYFKYGHRKNFSPAHSMLMNSESANTLEEAIFLGSRMALEETLKHPQKEESQTP